MPDRSPAREYAVAFRCSPLIKLLLRRFKAGLPFLFSSRV